MCNRRQRVGQEFAVKRDAGSGDHSAADRHGTEARPACQPSRRNQIDKLIEIDQSPIGRTPRSNPATYTGVFDEVRQRLC